MLCVFYLVNTFGHVVILDIRFICRIEEYQTFVFQCPIHPFFKFRSGHHRPGRIVGIAKVDHIHSSRGNLRKKSTVSGAGEQKQLIGFPDAHNRGVKINRVDRVCDGHYIVITQDIADVTGVALGTIADKNFIGRDNDSFLSEINLGYLFPQKIVALFRPITTKSVTCRHVVYCSMQGSNHGW
ncbi:hypothetical protein SDC9_126220 [bioreactor metagenome]|uniref:Uncharacterized protein n=1 Tax=bioreactor metagenome TaxID=1076179 RepID=A0A645CQK3_9ZZZZ